MNATRSEGEPAAGTPDLLMRLCTGPWAFKLVALTVEKKLYTRIAESGGIAVDDLMREWAIERRPATMVLTAVTELGLLTHEQGYYTNTSLASRYLVAGLPDYFGDYMLYCDRVNFHGWDRLHDAILSNAPVTQGKDQTFMGSGHRQDLFYRGMHSLSTTTGAALADRLDWSSHQRVIDIGGGTGSVLMRLVEQHPHMKGTVYDLPEAVRYASENIKSAGLDGRIDVWEGDFVAAEQLPRGYDAVLLSMIVHDWSESENRELLRKCYDAVTAGGMIVVAELFLPDDVDDPGLGDLAALMSMNMLVRTNRGQNPTVAECGEWMRAAGFVDVEVVSFTAGSANGTVKARKPEG